MRLILASQSPRRREILAAAGIEFEVRAALVDERPRPGEPPSELVMRLAREKAEAVPKAEDEVVLGADTLVVIDGDVLGKPAGADDAAAMLKRLAGRVHSVFTGICLIGAGRVVADVAETRVSFLPIADSDIQAYIDTGEPEGKAGAYAIQGRASKFIYRVEGCYFNVVGLPVSLVWQALRNFS